MNPIIVTPPAGYPVTLDEARAQLRLDDTDQDVLVSALIAAGTSLVETHTGLALITRAYRGFMDHWPADELRSSWTRQGPTPNGNFLRIDARAFELPRPPLVAVSAITTYDDADVATVMDPATYIVDADAFVGRIVLRRNATWPSVGRAANGIKVEWTAGFGPASTDIPAHFRQAILLLVSHFFEHREAVVGVDNRDSSAPLPLGVAELIGPHAVNTF